jgi:hypothetical protein
MRQITDSAAIDRAAGILTDLIAAGVDIKNAARRHGVPGNKPQYFRGALIKPK